MPFWTDDSGDNDRRKITGATSHQELVEILRADPLFTKYMEGIESKPYLSGALLHVWNEQGQTVLHENLCDKVEGFGLSKIAASSMEALIASPGRTSSPIDNRRPSTRDGSNGKSLMNRRRSSFYFGSRDTNAEDGSEPRSILRKQKSNVNLNRKSSPEGGDESKSGHPDSRKSISRRHGSGKSTQSGSEATSEIVIINQYARSYFSQVLPYVLSRSPPVVLLFGIGFYAVLLIFFALLFYTAGDQCYGFSSPNAEFSFAQMLYFSVHTFSTVGYGSIFPDCASVQAIVFFETYATQLVQGAFGGYIVFVLLKSRARVKFSKVCVVSVEVKDSSGGATAPDDLDNIGELEIRFRVVRETNTPLRDAKMGVAARYLIAVSMDPSSDAFESFLASMATKDEMRIANLELETDHMSSLDYWQAVHKITASSPLWPIRMELEQRLKSIDVTVSAFDPAFSQPVKLFTKYTKDEIIHGAHFEPMETTKSDGSEVTVDYSKLDLYRRPVRSTSRDESVRGRKRLGRSGSITSAKTEGKRRRPSCGDASVRGGLFGTALRRSLSSNENSVHGPERRRSHTDMTRTTSDTSFTRRKPSVKIAEEPEEVYAAPPPQPPTPSDSFKSNEGSFYRPSPSSNQVLSPASKIDDRTAQKLLFEA